MDKIRGNPSFEGPSKDELDDYLLKSRKSLNLMKTGNPPLLFRPKRNISIKTIGFIIILIVSSGLFITIPLLSFFPSEIPSTNNNTSNNSHTSSSVTNTLSLPPTTSSSTPSEMIYDLEVTIQEVEDFINMMITSDRSVIHPEMVNGTVNTSQKISIDELLDLVWYLSQFEEDSDWWELGRDLIFEHYIYWNDSFLLNENIRLKLKGLRTFLAYSPEKITLGLSDREMFNNFCINLWNNIITAFDNDSNTIKTENTSIRYTEDQITFIDILTRAGFFLDLFEKNYIEELAEQLINIAKNLTTTTDGIPESFTADRTWLSPKYLCNQQGALIIALSRLKTISNLYEDINLIDSRLHNFIHKQLIRQNWSFSKEFNSTANHQSDEIILSDQCTIIRVNVLFDYFNFASFTSNGLKEWFGDPNGGFYSSMDDNQTQIILDQIKVLLAFQELLELAREHESTGMAEAKLYGITILIVLFIIPLKRKFCKRKRKLNADY